MMINQHSKELLSDILLYIIENEYIDYQESEGYREGHIYEKAIELKNLINITPNVIDSIKSNMESTIYDAAQCVDEISDDSIEEIRNTYDTEEEQDYALGELVIDITRNEGFGSQEEFIAGYYAGLEYTLSLLNK